MKAIIIQPFIESQERTDQLLAEAESHLSALGYDLMNMDSIFDPIRKCFSEHFSSDSDANANVFTIGIMAIMMSTAGTVCFWEGWEDVPYCQDLYNLAFRYGLNIILKPPKEDS